ncbi:hypothetical protein [Pseudomonas sp. SDI]|uniref:hypothetical protein n=1 Tax=Pseudomonas sp. SDI TaxID=2170734 RepID=UPI0015A9BF89|nr:hypothetical protein [Pseudomonas sp. SDI]
MTNRLLPLACHVLAWSLAFIGQCLAAPEQVIQIGTDGQRYPFLVFANQPLQITQDERIEQAVVILHGVRRNADHYFAIGQTLLERAQLPSRQTLLLAPNFLVPTDNRARNDLPLWRNDSWMHGEPAGFGRVGVSAFQALDDIVGYLADREHFPALKRITLIGHSAGAQLMQRYAMLNPQDERLRQAGVAVRYVISSPSSYLYLDASRPQPQGFAPLTAPKCPTYNHYRYGLIGSPAYLLRQRLNGKQLFQRYAARDVTYLVGSDDNDPANRRLDTSCGAELQGSNRLERQLNYRAYEQYLGERWGVRVNHRQFQVSGVGHSATGLYGSPLTVRKLFPGGKTQPSD